MTTIFRKMVLASNRRQVATALFGVRFLWIESYAFDSAASLCFDFDGGPWDHYVLSNGGFYMAPRKQATYHVESATGFEADMSADALGLAATLCAFGLLSHSGEQVFAASCSENYRRLRVYASQHIDGNQITTVVDGG